MRAFALGLVPLTKGLIHLTKGTIPFAKGVLVSTKWTFPFDKWWLIRQKESFLLSKGASLSQKVARLRQGNAHQSQECARHLREGAALLSEGEALWRVRARRPREGCSLQVDHRVPWSAGRSVCAALLHVPEEQLQGHDAAGITQHIMSSVHRVTAWPFSPRSSDHGTQVSPVFPAQAGTQ